MHRSLALIALAGVFATANALPTRAPKDYDLLNVEWHVTLDFPHSSLTGDVINTVRPMKAGLQKVRFDAGPMDISSITVDGKTATFNREGEGLFVDLGAPGQIKPYKVEIKYSTTPTCGAYFVPGKRAYPGHTDVAYTQGEMEDNRYWLPTYDFPDNKAMTEGFITVPKGYNVLSNGSLIGAKDDGDQTTFHWKMNHPMSTYLISLVAGPYDVGHDHWGRMDVSYWVPEGLLPWGKAAFGGTDKIIDFYSKITGFKYPWPKFAQSAVPDFMFGGMENASAVTQTITALFPPTAAPIENSHGLVAHELAHQWFGDTVTCADWSHAWLNEGFATFMPIFWDRQSEGEDAFERGRWGAIQGGLGAQNSQRRPVVYSGYALPIDNFGGFIYAGGATRLFMLMDKLGEPAFWKGVKDYLDEYKFQPVTTDNFFDAMSKSSGVDLKLFEKQWLLTAAAPRLTLSIADGKVVLDQAAPYFDFDPWIWVLKDHKWTKTRVHTDGAHATYDLGDLTGAAVLLDPEGRCMMNVTNKIEYTPEQNLEIFKTGPVVQRDRLMRRLGSLTQDQIKDLIKHEPTLQLRETLIGMLDATSRADLMAYAHDKDARLRQVGLRGLVRLDQDGSDAEIEALLDYSYTKELNDDICNYAFNVQIGKDKTGKLADLGWKTDTFRESFRQAALNWWAQHDKDKARAMALEALDKPMTEPVRITALRVLSNLGEKKGEHVVYDHLLAVLQEGSFGAMQSAMGELVAYGNPDAAKYILPFTKSSSYFLRRAAQGAYARLTAGDN